MQRGVAQLGSALRSGRRGRGFKSRHPDQESLLSEDFGLGCPVALRQPRLESPLITLGSSEFVLTKRSSAPATGRLERSRADLRLARGNALKPSCSESDHLWEVLNLLRCPVDLFIVTDTDERSLRSINFGPVTDRTSRASLGVRNTPCTPTRRV